jgi:hypothetical protein
MIYFSNVSFGMFGLNCLNHFFRRQLSHFKIANRRYDPQITIRFVTPVTKKISKKTYNCKIGGPVLKMVQMLEDRFDFGDENENFDLPWRISREF